MTSRPASPTRVAHRNQRPPRAKLRLLYQTCTSTLPIICFSLSYLVCGTGSQNQKSSTGQAVCCGHFRNGHTRNGVSFRLGMRLLGFVLGLVWEATDHLCTLWGPQGGFLYIDSAWSHALFFFFFFHYTCSLLLSTTYLFVMHGNRRLLGLGLWIWYIRLGLLALSFLYSLLRKSLYFMG